MSPRRKTHLSVVPHDLEPSAQQLRATHNGSPSITAAEVAISHFDDTSVLGVLERIAIANERGARALERIADRLDPPPSTIVDSPYLANQLGCTKVWVAKMARDGEIPKSCIVPGTGDGKPWKFYRARIEQWLKSR